MSHDVSGGRSIKRIMAAGDVAFGMTARLARSGEVVRIARATGHDFLRIDTQHAIYDMETVGHLLQAALGAGVDTVVRVRAVGDPNAQLVLDAGATGIVFPDVSTAAEARRAVDTARFAPVGRRSYGGGYPHVDRSLSVPDTIEVLDDLTLVVCMVESAEGLANVEEIAAVDGVDVVHLGLNDLLLDLGRPGAYEDARLIEALERTVAATAAHGTFAGCGGSPTVRMQVEAIRHGVRFMTTRADADFLAAGASRWMSEIAQAMSGSATP